LGLAVLHAVWGEKNLSDELFKSNLSDVPKVGFYISYHQITSTLTASGLGLLAIAFIDALQTTRYLAIFIDLITLGNVAVFTFITLKKYPDLIRQSVPQIILFTVLLLLITAGARA